MPATLVSNTMRFIVYEVPNGETTLRLEISGRFLVIDPATGQITGGTIQKISGFEYAGDVTQGAGRTWANINLTASDLTTLLGTSDWQMPQPGSLAYYSVMGALPASTLVTTFTSIGTFVQGTDLVETLIGTESGDVIMGAGGDDRLYGRGGNDELQGEAGNDRLYGEDGDDVLLGGTGDDRLNGGTGYNTLYGGDGDDALSSNDDGAWMDGGAGNDGLVSGAGADDLRGAAGNDNLISGAGEDTLFGDDGNDRLNGGDDTDAMYGGAGNDRLNGGFGSDVLEGNDGNDRLDGDADDDVLFGGAGDDNLNGDIGNDQIHMETGNDTVTGGEGDDQFVFTAESSGAKIISAFNGVEDQVIFSQFDGDTPTAYQYFLENSVSVGRNVVFTDGDLSITFVRTQMSAFSQDTFGVIDNGGGSGGGIGSDIIG